MYFDKFQEINGELSERLKNSDFNYARLLLPAQEGNVAVIGKYVPQFLGNSFVSLNERLEAVESEDFSKFYYGASPKLDNSLIIDAISNLQFVNSFGLEKFVAEHFELFMLHKGQDKYLLPLAKYIVLALTYNYGIKIKFENEAEAETIVQQSDVKGAFLKKKGVEITVHGCPTEQLLNALDGYQYVDTGEGVFRAVPKGTTEGVTVYDVYCEKQNIALIKGDVFYSGVLTRALHIEERESCYSNKGVSSVYLYYERSTFATVFAFDNNFTDHPIIQKEKEVVVEFFREDDNCKRKYLLEPVLGGAQGREKLLTEVNEYLKKSYNVNQIGVTGNVITSDDFLLYGKRGAQAIDAGKIYPGVNGNAEIADENVRFYSDSVDVDYPTLDLSSSQGSFGKELSREAEAELNLSFNNNLWKCYGIIVSGVIPKATEPSAEYPFSVRRLHLNILFKQKTDVDFKKVRQLQSIATENYETSELNGLSVRIYKSGFDWLKKKAEACVRGVMKWKSIITSIFTIALFFLSLSTIRFSLNDWSSRVSVLFAVLVVIITLLDIVKAIKEKHERTKYERVMTIISNENVDKRINEVLNQILQGNNYYPMAYIALKLYLIECVYSIKTKSKEGK